MNNVLNKINNSYLRRYRHTITRRDNNTIIIDGKPLLNFCSNDYLCITTHTDVKCALANSANLQGLGSSASPLISGYSKSHEKLEESFANFLQRDRAILFNSGYQANLGVITTFANRNSVIIADKYSHASLHDAALLSRASFYRYRHRDNKHANELLNKYSTGNTLLLTESIFSMQGDIANLKELCLLAKKYESMLIVDDAHGIGVLGKCGAGISEYLQLSQADIPCLITPLGKAFGSMGAVVSGSREMIETLLQISRTYRYSTALPPAICDATLAALNIIRIESWRREKLAYLANFFIKEAKLRDIPLNSYDVTPIKSILVKSNEIALNLQKALMKMGLYVSCIRQPTVPANAACARISLNCFHEESHIIYLLDQVQEYYAGI